MARRDPHSYADLDQGRLIEAALFLSVDFGARLLRGRVRLTLQEPTSGPLDLDTRGLAIEGVEGADGAAIPYQLAVPDPVLGERLTVELPANTGAFDVRYATSPEASALQWLAPSQTAGGVHPYLFSQCQAIHARALVPIQDTPRARVRLRAEITVPKPLRVVMAASMEGDRDGDGDTTTWLFRMPQPIPPYLIALAAGNIQGQEVGPRSVVYAEPEVLERAAWEFGGVEDMIVTAEALFGPYEWDRFDLLCMPPSFPYGGMENPRLTFLTPTLLAGDRSQVSVVAHELAHSWTGNLVTNADMEHFWLNEGFTVYAERRILEALEGPEFMALHAAIGRSGLQREVDRFGADSPYTKLRTELAGVDPDEVFSLVPYEKGFLLVRLLHETVGQERFDEFLKRYIERFRFQSITTEEFEEFVEAELPGTLAQVRSQEWIRGSAIPDNEPRFHSVRKEAVDALAAGWAEGARPTPEVTQGWTPAEWLLYLQGLPRTVTRDDCAALDEAFGLTRQGNSEILVEWLGIAIPSGYEPAVDRACAFLREMGRMKYLKPLFHALAGNPDTKERATALFADTRDTYHPIAQMVVESVLG
ncbi:MAG: M1 family metallopeptidase [bacterium]